MRTEGRGCPSGKIRGILKGPGTVFNGVHFLNRQLPQYNSVQDMER